MTHLSPLLVSLRFLQTQPDARLVALARAGHERAFEALVRRYRRQLLGYCLRLGSSTTAAEDALQQTFLQAWIALRAGREVRDARAWLYRIAHNVVISTARQQNGIGAQLHPGTAARGADDEAEQRMAVREALAGLASLPELQRDVMVGAAVDGLSHAEIARELGLTSGAVRGLIYRARATLRVAAALFIPGPIVQWAARQGSVRASSSGLYETIAGGGSAGVGGLLLKGGVITATAGVLATAAGVVNRPPTRPRHLASPIVRVVPGSQPGAHRASGAQLRAATGALTAVEIVAVTARSAPAPRYVPASSSEGSRSIAQPIAQLQAARSAAGPHRSVARRGDETGADGHHAIRNPSDDRGPDAGDAQRRPDGGGGQSGTDDHLLATTDHTSGTTSGAGGTPDGGGTSGAAATQSAGTSDGHDGQPGTYPPPPAGTAGPQPFPGE